MSVKLVSITATQVPQYAATPLAVIHVTVNLDLQSVWIVRMRRHAKVIVMQLVR